MTESDPRPANLIWATRGREWGFRFLLDGGHPDPLPTYEQSIAELGDQPAAWHRTGRVVAVRFPDPSGRRDAARRVIPHEFVVVGETADAINSVGDGIAVLWPIVERAYDRVWDAVNAPSADDVFFS